MVDNYKILRKAQLADDLFMGDDDDAAWEQDQADREWARALDPDPEQIQAAQPWPAVQPRREDMLEPVEEEQSPDIGALVPVAAKRSWAQTLADLTGNPVLEGIRTLGVCALEKDSGAKATTAALAQWMAQSSETPALAVEAHFCEARLAHAFDAREQGLAEALVHDEPLDGLIQDTAEPNLKLLAGGGPLSGRERRAALREFPALLASLRERFVAIVVELPAVDDPAFEELPIAELADAVILVADSTRAQPRKLRRAAEKLRDARASLAASMLDSTQTLDVQMGHIRQAEQMQRVEIAHNGLR